MRKKNFWSSKRLKLKYFKPKFTCCIEKTKYIKCVKAKKYKSYKEKKEHNNLKCISQKNCYKCIIKRDICTYTVYILYVQCNKNIVKSCENCEELPQRYEDIIN